MIISVLKINEFLFIKMAHYLMREALNISLEEQTSFLKFQMFFISMTN